MPGRGPRSIKPDPNQPILKSINSKPRRLSSERPDYKGTKTPTETKRKRRSTGDKRAAKHYKELELKKSSMTVEKNQDQLPDPIDKMSNIGESSNSSNTEDSTNLPNTDMVQEMRNMEARLKDSRKSELDELKVKLTNSMKVLLDKSVENALKKLQGNLSQEITKHPTIQQHTSELVHLRAENKKLNQQVKCLDREFSKLQSKISDMEQRTLDKSVIMRGLRESNGETEYSLREQVHRELSNTIKGPDYESRLIIARKMTI